jgi:hypothetical protein
MRETPLIDENLLKSLRRPKSGEKSELKSNQLGRNDACIRGRAINILINKILALSLKPAPQSGSITGR